jgi:hypothetical protein
MFTRLWTFTGASNIDSGVAYLRDEVLPVLNSQRGYRGVLASAARSEGVLGILSLWDTEADSEASDSALGKAREEAAQLVGGDLTVEAFEQVVAQVNGPAMPGSAFIMIRVSGDPAMIDEIVSFFKSEILPQIKTAPGLLVLRDMVNRKTGEGIISSAWADQEAMRLATGRNLALRPQAAASGVNFGEASLRKIVLAETSGELSTGGRAKS